MKLATALSLVLFGLFFVSPLFSRSERPVGASDPQHDGAQRDGSQCDCGAPSQGRPFVAPAPEIIARAKELRIKLPFAEGSSYRCAQGYGGAVSHQPGSANEHAWDFATPIGTPVLAAAHGRVVRVVDHFSAGGFDPSFQGKSNEIWIDHGGGVLTTYVHLQPASSSVQVGQLVCAGQVVAASGNTGYSKAPHLHFAVIDSRGTSVPSAFVKRGLPKVGDSCRSKNDGSGVSWFAGDSHVAPGFFAGQGIELGASPPAHIWPEGASYTCSGHVAKGVSELVFFFSSSVGGAPIAREKVQVGPDGAFEFTASLPSEAQLGSLREVSFALTPLLSKGHFETSNMVTVTVLEKSPVAPLFLPFPDTEERAVTEATTDAGRRELSVAGAGTVLSCAGGRVLAVGTSRGLGVGSNDAKTSALAMDHGGGRRLIYSGLDPETLGIRPGDVIPGGTPLGEVSQDRAGRRGQLVLTEAGSVKCQFMEIGEPLADGAALVSKNAAASHGCFHTDSRLEPGSFGANGVTMTGELPLAYVQAVGPKGGATWFEGTTDIDAKEIIVECLGLPARGRSVVLAKKKILQGEPFRLEVDFASRVKGDGWRYALRARGAGGKRKPKVQVWNPLLLLR